ncbi:corepressor interacting with RBPJ 1-like [Mizuhopecten yessoensis]|uniref:Corepressor interacting with RBPJ 1 n=1 Tax=Mizuhopecten yessoensis TaxID=6573 RepID=A0A210R3A3_MIZYE|nr:corepressor interacting with RBPJ 1-like [Mizuhopecten yessoensis]OWF55477.1 Corepressor interacting with RBPJ 1 [Mizuhopecten yessoensis]
MGKGFNNYMTKKFFHPASKENIKRVWMAEQKTQFDKTKQEDLLAQYQKEQDMYRNRALLGDEKAKLGLSFMYDAPPGMKKKEQEEGEAEVKFDWQRKYNAPREQYAKDDEMIRDQPFGVEVRNVRCIKCRKWGHVNTDKICPLFGKDLTAEPEQPENSASSLLESMQEDGFALKQSILGRMSDPRASNEQIIKSEDEDDPEVQFLKSLTPKQKKKLLKRLNKLQTKGKDTANKKSKKKKKKKQKRKSASSDSDESPKRQRHRKVVHSDSSSSDSDSSDDEPVRKRPREDSRGRHRQRMDSDSDGSPYRSKHKVKKHLRQNSSEDRPVMKGAHRQDKGHRDRSSSSEEQQRGRKGHPSQSKNYRKLRHRSSSEEDRPRVKIEPPSRREQHAYNDVGRNRIKKEPNSQRDRHNSGDEEVSRTVQNKSSEMDRERDSRQDGHQIRYQKDSASGYSQNRHTHSPVVRRDRGRRASPSPRKNRSRSHERGRRSRSNDRRHGSRSGDRRQRSRSNDRRHRSRSGDRDQRSRRKNDNNRHRDHREIGRRDTSDSD